MSKSRLKKDEIGLLTTGVLLSIKNNNHAEAIIYMEYLLKYLPVNESCHEISFLLGQVNDESKLIDCIHWEHRAPLLQYAISRADRKLINFLLSDNNFISKASSNSFCSILANFLKYELFDLAESALDLRKKTNETTFANELNKTLILVQLHEIPSRIASINFLYGRGANPMEKCQFSGTTYISFLTAIDTKDDQLISIYLRKSHLNKYKDEELVTIFKELIKAGYFKQAEWLLTEKKAQMTKNLNQKTLDKLIYLIATNISSSTSVHKETLITLLIDMGANPVTYLRENKQNASQIYCSVDWIYLLGRNIDKYTASDLAFAVLDSILGKFKHKLESVKYILTEKQILLAKYYHEHPDELDFLLYASIGNKNDALTRLLFDMGANPIRPYQHNSTAFDIALNNQYYYAVKEILETHIQSLSPGQLAKAFKVASDNKWLDLTIMIASNRNKNRKATIDSLLLENIDEFTGLILNEMPPNTDLLHYLCINNEIDPDSKKMHPSLLDYAIQHNEYSMLNSIILYNYNHLSAQRMGEIISFLLDEKDNNDSIINIEYMKYLNYAKEPDQVKQEIAAPIFMRTIQKAKTVLEIMIVIDVLIKNPKSFEYLHNSMFHDELKKIFAEAALRIETIAKEAKEIVFDNSKQLQSVHAFLSAQAKHNLFGHPDENFMKLVNGKIKYTHTQLLTPSVL